MSVRTRCWPTRPHCEIEYQQIEQERQLGLTMSDCPWQVRRDGVYYIILYCEEVEEGTKKKRISCCLISRQLKSSHHGYAYFGVGWWTS